MGYQRKENLSQGRLPKGSYDQGDLKNGTDWAKAWMYERMWYYQLTYIAQCG